MAECQAVNLLVPRSELVSFTASLCHSCYIMVNYDTFWTENNRIVCQSFHPFLWHQITDECDSRPTRDCWRGRGVEMFWRLSCPPSLKAISGCQCDDGRTHRQAYFSTFKDTSTWSQSLSGVRRLVSSRSSSWKPQLGCGCRLDTPGQGRDTQKELTLKTDNCVHLQHTWLSSFGKKITCGWIINCPI